MPSDAPRPDDLPPTDALPPEALPPDALPPDALPPDPLPRGGVSPSGVTAEGGRPLLTISRPRDLVALVPYRLGYRPTDSVVVLCLRGDRLRVGLVMRADLPAPADLPGVVSALARHAVDDGASAVVAVLYRHGPLPPTTVPVITGVLADAGVELREAWQVGACRLWSLTCDDDSCCPGDGWPVEVLDAAQVSAEMVVRGRAVAPTREALAGDLRPVEAARAAAVGHLVARHAAGRPARGEPLVSWRRTALSTWRAVLREGSPAGEVPEPAAAVLLAGLADPAVRDAVLLDCVPGAQDAADELVRSGSARATAALETVFSAGSAVAPEEERQERADAVLRSLVRQGQGTTRAAPLGLLAWSAWWAGDGGRSSVLTELALLADPAHRLAQLLSAALAGGLAPGWAQRDRLAQTG